MDLGGLGKLVRLRTNVDVDGVLEQNIVQVL